MQGRQLNGSIAAPLVKFAGVVVNTDWIAANKGLQVKLEKDLRLIDFLVQDSRLTGVPDKNDGVSLKEKYARLLLYFVLTIHGAHYRFYINDPFPGKIQEDVMPASVVVDRWDLQRAFRQ
jgi:hypothetical protein